MLLVECEDGHFYAEPVLGAADDPTWTITFHEDGPPRIYLSSAPPERLEDATARAHGVLSALGLADVVEEVGVFAVRQVTGRVVVVPFRLGRRPPAALVVQHAGRYASVPGNASAVYRVRAGTRQR